VPFGRHFADIASELSRNLETPDTAHEHGCRRFGDFLRVPGCIDGQPELPRLVKELVHRVETDRNEYRVAGERLLGSRQRAPVPVHPGDGHRLDVLFAVGADHRMRGIDRHAHSHDLVLVDLVSPALRHRLTETGHVDSGLKRMVGSNQADVAAADHEQAFGRTNEVTVGERLKGTRPVDARKRVALENERLLAGPGRDQQRLRLDEEVAPVAKHSHLAVGEH
jgi:hypothetical protein